MPKLAVPLTELQVRKAKAAEKAYVLADGIGLSLLVSPAGLKTWTVRYRLPDGPRPAPATIGHYPSMTLADARIAEQSHSDRGLCQKKPGRVLKFAALRGGKPRSPIRCVVPLRTAHAYRASLVSGL